MKLAAQLFTVRDFTKTQDEIEKTLKKVKEIGYNSVQVSAFGEYDPYWLAEKIKELGLEICASHTPFDRIIDDTDAVIKEHKAWGCKYIGLGMGFFPNQDKSHMDVLLDKLDKPIRKIADSGLLFVYHNHGNELKKIELDTDVTYLDYMAERYPANLLGFLADFYWTTFADYDAIKFIDKYEDRLKVVHFKDLRIDEKGEKKITEVGNGIIDHKKIYDRLLSGSTEFVAVEQDENWTVNPFESLSSSYKFLTKMAKFE